MVILHLTQPPTNILYFISLSSTSGRNLAELPCGCSASRTLYIVGGRVATNDAFVGALAGKAEWG